MFQQVHRPSRVSCGYTLLELMVVLAILVSVMAVAWPRITRRLQLIGPREAAMQLKSDLAEAREQAVITGEAWVVRIERGSGQYEFGPVSAVREEVLKVPAFSPVGGEDAFPPVFQPPNPTEAGANAIGFDGGARVQIRRNELPSGMVFDDGFAHQSSDVNAVRMGVNQHPSHTQPMGVDPNSVPIQLQLNPMQASPTLDVSTTDKWKFAVIFQPDGRATESEIRLKERATDNKIPLRVRGFTGGVTIGKLERKKPDPTLLDAELVGREQALLDPDAQQYPLPQGIQPSTPDSNDEFPTSIK